VGVKTASAPKPNTMAGIFNKLNSFTGDLHFISLPEPGDNHSREGTERLDFSELNRCSRGLPSASIGLEYYRVSGSPTPAELGILVNQCLVPFWNTCLIRCWQAYNGLVVVPTLDTHPANFP